MSVQPVDATPGFVFVQRNAGNLAMHQDLNCMSTIEYAVEHLKARCGPLQITCRIPDCVAVPPATR